MLDCIIQIGPVPFPHTPLHLICVHASVTGVNKPSLYHLQILHNMQMWYNYHANISVTKTPDELPEYLATEFSKVTVPVHAHLHRIAPVEQLSLVHPYSSPFQLQHARHTEGMLTQMSSECIENDVVNRSKACPKHTRSPWIMVCILRRAPVSKSPFLP